MTSSSMRNKCSLFLVILMVSLMAISVKAHDSTKTENHLYKSSFR